MLTRLLQVAVGVLVTITVGLWLWRGRQPETLSPPPVTAVVRPKIASGKFEMLYRAVKTVEVSTTVGGVPIIEFRGQVRAAQTEVAIAADKSTSDFDKEIVQGFSRVVQEYVDSTTMWNLKVRDYGGRYIAGGPPIRIGVDDKQPNAPPTRYWTVDEDFPVGELTAKYHLPVSVKPFMTASGKTMYETTIPEDSTFRIWRVAADDLRTVVAKYLDYQQEHPQ
jgi:hypothetical protein